MKKGPEELLNSIGRVAPPDYLWTRVSTRIDEASELMQPRVIASIGLASLLILFLNINLLLSSVDRSDRKQVADAFGLSVSEQLYND